MTWALDLDGVVWRGDVVIDGSPEAVSELARRNIEVFYVTNSSAHRAAAYVEKLERFGIDANASQIIHGGHAVARLTKPGERVLVCAGNGVVEALEHNEVDIIDPADIGDIPPQVDAVVMGWMPNYDYRRLALATRAVLAGARLLATNMDPVYPKHDGMVPGTGALASAVAFATGAQIEAAGKPNQPMVEVVQAVAKQIDVMVGDQPASDGALAEKLNAKFVLVMSGVYAARSASRSVEVPVDATAADLRSAVTEWFANANS